MESVDACSHAGVQDEHVGIAREEPADLKADVSGVATDHGRFVLIQFLGQPPDGLPPGGKDYHGLPEALDNLIYRVDLVRVETDHVAIIVHHEPVREHPGLSDPLRRPLGSCRTLHNHIPILRAGRCQPGVGYRGQMGEKLAGIDAHQERGDVGGDALSEPTGGRSDVGFSAGSHLFHRGRLREQEPPGNLIPGHTSGPHAVEPTPIERPGRRGGSAGQGNHDGSLLAQMPRLFCPESVGVLQQQNFIEKEDIYRVEPVG